MNTEELILPTQRIKAERINARNMILFGLPKCGKTTAISTLENCLIIDTEQGSGFINGMKIQIPENKGPVGKFKWLKDLAQKIRDEGYPYDYVAIDTLTQIDEISEWKGTWDYMNSSQGMSFNRVKDATGQPIKGGAFLDPSDPDYESVHNLPQGFGYRFSRNAMTEIYDALQGLGKICTIFVVHVSDKAVISKITNTEVVTRDLSLTGKVKDIISRKVDALGYVYHKDNKTMVSFAADENKIGGIRAKHLGGYVGPLEWDVIFIKEK